MEGGMKGRREGGRAEGGMDGGRRRRREREGGGDGRHSYLEYNYISFMLLPRHGQQSQHRSRCRRCEG